MNKTSLLKISFSILLIIITHAAKTQNQWFTGINIPNQEKTIETDCPLYNVGDPELVIEYQHALGNCNSYAVDIAFTSDSTSFILLYLGKGGSYIAKYSDNGQELWMTFLAVNDSTEFDATQFITIGDNYYIAGYWGEIKMRNYGVIKVNNNGKQQWIKLLKTEVDKKYSEIKRVAIFYAEDNNFLFSTNINDTMYITKYDSTCNKLWDISSVDLNYQNESNYTLKAILTRTHYVIYIKETYWQLDFNGKILYTDTINGNWAWNLFPENTNIYACGYTEPNQWIRKYTQDFDLKKEYLQDVSLKQREISSAKTIEELADKSLLVFYDFYYDGTGMGDIHYNVQILHLDANLNCKSTINLYGAGSQIANKLLINKDGDYIIFGDGYYAPDNCNKLFLAKIRKWPLPVKSNETLPLFTLYPNPINTELNIAFKNKQTGMVNIYSPQGNLLYSKKLNNVNNAILSIDYLPSGLMLLEYINNDKRIIEKIIKN
ncbi:MAG: hypothetical protein CVU09_07705 [Bacteroidetes bacterium HGW-Bacteroidetes-4]|jgi:hypothetical protein|nr:MAG: hypothetical protein CVU09_07705 [Bacteroidetes bacterium HGW-Bacteroidetes-4]